MRAMLRFFTTAVIGLAVLLAFAGGSCKHTRQVRLQFVNLPTSIPGESSGAAFTFDVDVQNAGNKNAGAYQVEAWLSIDESFDSSVDTKIGQSAVQAGLSKGGTATVTVAATVPVLYPSGTWILFVRIPGQTGADMIFPVLISGSTPDFTVVGLGLSKTIIQRGTTIQVDWNLANLGGGTGTVKNGFYLSLDNIFDGADTFLNLDVAPDFSPGSSVQKTSLVTLPGNLPVGQYYFIFMANYDGAVAEVDSFNNQIAIQVGIVTNTGPDYVVGNNFIGDSLVVGQGTTFVVSQPAANAGTVDATSAVEIGAYLMPGPFLAHPAGTLAGATSVGPLTAGQSQMVNFNVVIPPTLPPGDYYLGYFIDDLNFEIESNEANNGSPTALIHVAADDSYENNDSQTNSAVIAKSTLYSGLMSLLGDDDWYRVTVGGFTNQLTATLTNTTPGDLSVAIYNGSGVLVGAGSVTGTGWAGTLTQLPPGNYYFRVQHLTSDFVTEYSLRIDAIEQPAVILTSSGDIVVNETLGNTDSYTIELSRVPKAGETVTVTLGYDNTQFTPVPNVVNFTNADYNVPVNIDVTAINDAIAEGNQTYTITHAVTTNDGTSDYNSATAGTITVQISD